ncbi:MAG: DNA topoisomerase (ATP-hydrolyzing) subunit B [Phycisphaerales bacterium]|nr:DNA topoisomerase (ATP-hydrolyzing) subunit B [Phycisphaerales bacterium]
MPDHATAPMSETEKPKKKRTDQAYGADQIKILEGLEAVRKRPGMYIGDTGVAGLHQLVWEAVDNSIDEAMAGRATTVEVRIFADGSISVTDDGSGIPVDKKRHENPQFDGKPAVEIVMTVLHAGGKFGEEGSAYKVSGGLHGVGISCVNALSEWLDVEVFRENKIHKISFARGVTSKPLHVVGDMDDPNNTGTRVHFKPDRDIFGDVEFNHSTLEHRLRELAYLNPGVIIRLTDERVGPDGNIKDHTFQFQDGIAEYVAHLNHNKGTIHDVVMLRGQSEDGKYACEIALQYNDSYNELLLSFANNIRTVDGGTHLSGLKTALTRTLNNYAKSANLLKEKDPTPSGEDLREGLAAVVSVKLPEPQFEGQTKGKLRNTDVEGFVSQIVGEKLGQWLGEHPSEAKKICQKGVLAAQAREAARRARDLTRRKSALESGSMPHKLRDCTTKDIDRSEMFIVEGDSAGGSATQGRDVETQAILPLRGKLLNVEKARLDKVLAFEEIRTLISALKCGIGEDFDIAKLRYGRVIIMTDADVDGSHIRTLLLTFFFRQMPELIERGKVYIAQPPLYQVTRGKRSQYVLNEKAMADVLIDLGLDGTTFVVRDTQRVDEKTGEPRVEREVSGDDLRRLVRALRRMRELVEIVERRGVTFPELLETRAGDPAGKNRLPSHRVTWAGGAGSGAAFFWSEEDAQAFVRQREDLKPASITDEQRNGASIAVVRELHENRELSLVFGELSSLGVAIDDYALTQGEDVTGAKLATKYAWRTTGGAGKPASRVQVATDEDSEDGDESVEVNEAASADGKLIEAAGVPQILETLLDAGRRGMEIKRFKGLGEMDPEQLWETTMDSSRRTLLRVALEDASAADELFTTLMGENVEVRRSYIEDHALEVKSLDV